jgi:hypothetical protein
MLGHASAAMTLDVYAGLFNADPDNVADRLDEAGSRATGVSRVCPQDGPDGGDETVGNWGDDDDDGVGGVPALVS